MIKYFDIFSGIGGFAYAAQKVWGNELDIVGFCEIEEFAQKVLRKNFPGVPIYPDVTKLKGSDIGTVDILTGGFPCQPFSIAGKRKGGEDERALFPEMLRLATETKARWIIAENVYGIVNIENGDYLETIISLMESEGYEVQPYIIPASAVGAPHRRDRIWIVAHSYGKRRGGGRNYRSQGHISENERTSKKSEQEWKRRERRSGTLDEVDTNSHSNGLQGIGEKQDGSRQNRLYYRENKNWSNNWYEVATRFCRVDDGVSDRTHRLKALGNAIVPQVAIPIFETIKEIESV